MENLHDLIIIGAGPAGLAAAIYAGRAKLNTLVVEGPTSGGQIAITAEIVNYPGILKTNGEEYSKTMRQQAASFGVSFVSGDVVKLDLEKDIKEVFTTSGEVFRALSVIVATGAKPRSLGFQGEKEFTGHGVAYCATCDGEFFTGMDIFVIGAGFAAAEESIFLTRFAKKVTIIAREPEFTCSKTIADKVLQNDRIDVRFNTELLSLSGDSVPRKARFINNVTKEEWVHEVDDPDESFGVFVFIGYEPISGLFKDKLNMDKYGYIITDEDMKTNIEGVYAAGDIRPKRLRQLVTAVSDGAIAATSIERYVEVKKERLGITVEPPIASTDGVKDDKVASADDTPEDAFIDGELREQLKPFLEGFESPVKIALYTSGDDALSNELAQVAQEFSELSDKISFSKHTQQEDENNIGNYPALALFRDDGSFTGITYHGVPGGHEFNSFVYALYNTAGPGQKVEPEAIERINEIDKPLDLKVYVSLSCSMCPELVTSTQLIATKNPNVTAGMYDLSYFPDVRKKYSIMSVPAMVYGDGAISFGAKNVSEVLDLVLGG